MKALFGSVVLVYDIIAEGHNEKYFLEPVS